MHGLGYRRYGAQGGDFGAGVGRCMALDNPDPMLGIHLSNLDVAPYLGRESRPLSQSERAYLAQFERWREDDRGYGAIQSTRSQTVGYGLNDSPAGLAAWLIEKWRASHESGREPDAPVSPAVPPTLARLYWRSRSMPCFDRRHVGA